MLNFGDGSFGQQKLSDKKMTAAESLGFTDAECIFIGHSI